MVPTFTWGLVLSYFFLAISASWGSGYCSGGFRGKRRILPLHLGDDLVDQALGQGLVVVELHRVAGTTLGHAAQLGGVAEHVGQRDVGVDHLGGAAPLHAEDGPATPTEVTHHVAHVLL